VRIEAEVFIRLAKVERYGINNVLEFSISANNNGSANLTPRRIIITAAIIKTQ
jgi:hypothetical protein